MERGMGEMEGKKFPDNFDYTAPIKDAEPLTVCLTELLKV
jgi:hypothetical protein